MGKISRLKIERGELKKELHKRSTTYVITALGLIAGLAWNDAIRSLIEYLFPLSQNTLFAKFFYAVFITVFLTVVAVYLTKMLERDKEGDKK